MFNSRKLLKRFGDWDVPLASVVGYISGLLAIATFIWDISIFPEVFINDYSYHLSILILVSILFLAIITLLIVNEIGRNHRRKKKSQSLDQWTKQLQEISQKASRFYAELIDEKANIRKHGVERSTSKLYLNVERNLSEISNLFQTILHGVIPRKDPKTYIGISIKLLVRKHKDDDGYVISVCRDDVSKKNGRPIGLWPGKRSSFDQEEYELRVNRSSKFSSLLNETNPKPFLIIHDLEEETSNGLFMPTRANYSQYYKTFAAVPIAEPIRSPSGDVTVPFGLICIDCLEPYIFYRKKDLVEHLLCIFSGSIFPILSKYLSILDLIQERAEDNQRGPFLEQVERGVE